MITGRFATMFLCTIVGAAISAQTVSMNSEGRRVVISEDGSWRYFEPGDSLLLNLSEVPLETIMEKSNPLQTNTITGKVFNYQTYLLYLEGAKRYEADLSDQMDLAQEKVYETQDAIQYAEAKNNRQLREEKQSALRAAQAEKRSIQKMLGAVRSEIAKIEKIGSKANFQKLRNIEIPVRYLKAEHTDPVALQTVLKPDKRSSGKEQVSKIDHATGTESENNSANQKKVAQTAEPGREIEMPKNQAVLDDRADVEVAGAVPAFIRSTPLRPVGQYECKYAFEGYDEFTRQQKKELVEELLFTYTDARLKPYFRDREHVTCSAYMSSISGGFRYLNLVFRIASKSARREYGYIGKNTLINLKLMNGKTVSLYCQRGDTGTIDAQNGDTVYKAIFQIDVQKERLIEKSELDKIRVVWSTGYEDYDVHNVDLLINQLDCLGSK